MSGPIGHTSVDIIAKSRFTKRSGIVSAILFYPRPIHAELMTQRLFSRNAASSRAVPVATMIERVRTQMFVPWHWLSNQKGMSGGVPLPQADADACKVRWIADAEHAMESARFYASKNLLKGLGNRCLEPFMYIQTLVTARIEGLPHFFNLRNDPDAENHFQDLAALAEQKIEETPDVETDAHLPFITAEERGQYHLAECLRVSSVRSRRVSYFNLPTVGDDGTLVYPKTPPAWNADLVQSAEMMDARPIHASPFEHPAYLSTYDGRVRSSKPIMAGNLALPGEESVDFVQYRKELENEFMRTRVRRVGAK